MDASEYAVRKALVALSVEKTLLDMNKAVYEEVAKRLYKTYKCYLPDCFDHPDYLKKVLMDLYGKSHEVIIDTISKYLDEFSKQKEISSFLKVICQ